VGDLTGVIKYLYTDFILRDLFSKVVPGSLIVLGFVTAVTGWPPGDLIRGVEQLPVIVIVAGLGLTWSIGFVAQQMSFIVLSPVLERFKQHRHLCIPRSFFRVEFVGLVARRTELSAEQRKSLERLAIIKEATGNLAMAIALLGPLWFLGDKWNRMPDMHLPWPPLGGLSFGVVVVLVLLHCDHYCKEIQIQLEMEKLNDARPHGNVPDDSGSQATYVLRGTLSKEDSSAE
jgi:hypothetical protein